MQFTEEQIEIRPGHEMRTWQSCDYYANGVELFHERTYFPHSPFKAITVEQWTSAVGSMAEIEALAAKHSGTALECFYEENLWFLSFRDSDKAIAFCRSADFDKHCLTMAKVE
jgi:hypothetical protein